MPSNAGAVGDILRYWLAGRYTPRMVAREASLIGGATVRAARAYRLLWCWFSPKFEGEAGREHDRFESKCGPAMYYSRVDRARRLIHKLRCEAYGVQPSHFDQVRNRTHAELSLENPFLDRF